MAIPAEPELLFGVSEGDEEEVGVGGVDTLADGGVLLIGGRQLAPLGVDEGRVNSGDAQAGVRLDQEPRRRLGNVLTAPEEVQGRLPRRGGGRQGRHQVGPRDPGRQRAAQQLRRPHQWHPVGGRQVGFAQDPQELGVPMHRSEPAVRVDHEIDVDGDDQPRPTVLPVVSRQREDGLHRGVQRHSIQRQSQDDGTVLPHHAFSRCAAALAAGANPASRRMTL